MNNNINKEVEMKLKTIKKQSDLRTKYLNLVEEELKNGSIQSFAKNKSIKKLELKIKETKMNNN